MQREPTFLPFLQRHRGAFDAVLFDIDGTLIDHGHALPGAAETLAWLRAAGLPFLCLTNDGNHSVAHKAQYLAKSGLAVPPAAIVSCAHAIEEFAESAGLAGSAVFIFGDLGVRFSAFAPTGAGPTGSGPAASNAEVPDSTVFRETRDLALLPQCDGIIIGEGSYDWMATVTAAFNYFIHKPEAFLIVPNPDSFWPNGHRGLGIGAGGMARFLERLLQDYGIAKAPTYLGKPYPLIFQRAFHVLRHRHGEHAGADPSRILVVGDSLSADIAGANTAGCRSVLVLTGLTRPKRLEDDCGRTGIRPWLVADGLGG